MEKSKEKISILIADDHPLLRDGIVQLLTKEDDFDVVGLAADGVEAVKMADEKSPDVVLMDIEMPNLDGLDATRQIKTARPDTTVLILTVHDDEEYVAAVLDAGAAGYLLKTTYGQELVQAIRAVRLGEFVLDTQVGPKVFRAYKTRSASRQTPPGIAEKLSDKEIEVAKLVGLGKTNEEISAVLHMSVRSVKACLSDIFAKLGVGSRVEAITTCLHAGIFSLEDIFQN
jgi:NarL family two-component system response regulator LiaR